MKKRLSSHFATGLTAALACVCLLFCAFYAAAANAAEEEFSGKLTLSASPESPYRGETVTLRLSPALDPARFGTKWEWEGAAENFAVKSGDMASYEAGESAAVVTASVWNRVSGSEAAPVKLEVVPKSYGVAVRILTSEDVVQLWDDDAKALTDRRGRLTGSGVTLEAQIDPVPEGELKYVWTHGPGAAFRSGEASGNTRVAYRDTTGPVLVSVAALGENGLRLGEAEFTFQVDISSEELDRSLKLNMGWERWQSALALREKGEVENALTQARQAFEELTSGGMKDGKLGAELERFRQLHINYTRALSQSSVAASLWRDGKPEEALAQYRQAKTLYAHASIEKSIAEVEGVIKRTGELKEKAAALAKEGQALAEAGDLAGALGKYGESLASYPSEEVSAALAGVEGRLKAMERKRELAETARQVAISLEAQENFEDALAKIAEAAEIWPLPELPSDAERLNAKVTERRLRRERSAAIAKEGSELELKGLEGQGDPDVMAQALEKYRQAAELWRDDSAERAVVRAQTYIDRIHGEIDQALFLVKEADLLSAGNRPEEALDRYRRAQTLRRSEDAENKIVQLEALLEQRQNLLKEAEGFYLRAEELEAQGKPDEALEAAKQGEAVLSANGLTGSGLTADGLTIEKFAPAVKRLEMEIAARDEKIARAASLTELAKAEPHPEKALDLFRESEGVWHSDEVAQTIRALSGLLAESRAAESRASELYKEAVVLERESKFAEAEEKLLASIAAKDSPESQALLGKVREDTALQVWLAGLQAQPLELRAVPLIPYVGERTTVYIEGGAWASDPALAYRWTFSGGALSGEPLSEGRAYGFYPSDENPVTVTLTVLRAGTEQELITRTASVTPEPRAVRVSAAEAARAAQWNTALKRLEETGDIASGTEIGLRAYVVPMPEDAVFYSWSVDDGSVLTVPENLEDNKASVRRTSPGTARVEVTAKDQRGVVLGKGQLSILAAADSEAQALDLKRARAWSVFTEAEKLWRENKHLLAVEKAAEASSLDPGDPDITYGLSKMKDDLAKMETASRLLAESSLLIRSGKLNEAEAKVGEAETLWPGGKTVRIRYELAGAREKERGDALLAASLRSEGDALLRQGTKEEALVRFQNSLLVSENDAVRRGVAELTGEIQAEKALLEEVSRLRSEGNALVDARHYAAAVERFERSMSLQPDEYLASYAEALREMADRERAFMAEAAKIRAEGDELLKDKKAAEAIAKYKESLQVWHDEPLAIRVREEEERIAQAAAAQLRKEAEAFVKARKPSDALAKYKESLTYAHNDDAAAYVKREEERQRRRRR